MIVKIYQYSEHVYGSGQEDFYEFTPVKDSEYYGHIDTGDTPARLETDENGLQMLYLGDGEEPEGYTAEQIVGNCAAYNYGIYFHRY